MNKQWLPENSVADSEIELMSQKGAVRAFHIVEHEAEELYYVTLFYTWRAELLHLSTRRVKTEPKMWKSLDRLIAHIKARFTRIRRISLMLRDQEPKTMRLPSEREDSGTNTTSLSPRPSFESDAAEAKEKAKKPASKTAAKKSTTRKPSTKARAKASKSLVKVSRPSRK